MSEWPDISIVIPTHERPASLSETLESAIAAHASGQNPGFEVIIIDDASRDSTGEVVNAAVAAGAGPPIRYERLSVNSGSYVARNAGAALATGSLLLFLDDDMLIRPDHVAAHARAHSEEGPRTIVLGNRWEFTTDALARWNEGNIGRFRLEVENWIREGLRETGKSSAGRNRIATIHTGDMSISRETFGALGPFDEEFRWIGDQEYALRALEHGVEIVWDPQIRTFHNDQRWSFRHYCKRIEDGSRAAPLLARRHPAVHDKGEMIREDGPISTDDPLGLRMKKRAKAVLARPRVLKILHTAADHSARLPYPVARRLLWGVLGLHVFIGVREGLAQERASLLDAEEPAAGQTSRMK